jgi:hypothetical protein
LGALLRCLFRMHMMACCGKKSSKTIAVKNIVTGYANYSVNKLFVVAGELSKDAARRQEICQQCEFVTWLKKADYVKWLIANGIDVAKEIDDLTVLPMLEKYEYEQGRSMFCRLCKCWLPGKAYSPDSKCPKDKW